MRTRARLSSIWLVVAVVVMVGLLLGGGVLGLLHAGGEADVARVERDALQVQATRVELLDALSSLALARQVVSTDVGDAAAVEAAASRWDQVRSEAIASLQLMDSPVGSQATELRDGLVRIGDVPDVLDDVLGEYVNPVLGLLVFPELPSERELGPAESTALGLASAVPVGAFTVDRFLFVEASTGLEQHDPELMAYFDLPEDQPLATGAVTEVRRRVVEPMDTRQDLWGQVDRGALREVAPLRADQLDELLRSDEAVLLASVHAWAQQSGGDDQPTARPAALADVVAAADVVDEALAGLLGATVDDRAAIADATAASWQQRARLLLAATLLALVAGVVAIGLLLRVRREQERLLRAAADTDPLTGVANRRALEAMADARLEAGEPATHAAIVFDLDGFKPVNDQYGHAVGDQVLVRFAKLCNEHVRDDSSVVARLGGDEFAILLFDLDPDEARAVADRVAERVARGLAEGLRFGDLLLDVRASHGVAVATSPTDLEALLAVADARLYEAKHAGVPRRRATT